LVLFDSFLCLAGILVDHLVDQIAVLLAVLAGILVVYSVGIPVAHLAVLVGTHSVVPDSFDLVVAVSLLLPLQPMLIPDLEVLAALFVDQQRLLLAL